MAKQKGGGAPKRAINNKHRYLAYRSNNTLAFNAARRLMKYLSRKRTEHEHDEALKALKRVWDTLYDAQRKVLATRAYFVHTT